MPRDARVTPDLNPGHFGYVSLFETDELTLGTVTCERCGGVGPTLELEAHGAALEQAAAEHTVGLDR